MRCIKVEMESLRRSTAFTLVEILIVVVIVGVMAAIAIPAISGSANDAGDVTAAMVERELNAAAQRYASDHGRYPSLANVANELVRFTSASGDVASAKSAVYRFGPYLDAMPAAPTGLNAGLSTVVQTGSTAASGWHYDETTGRFTLNVSAGAPDASDSSSSSDSDRHSSSSWSTSSSSHTSSWSSDSDGSSWSGRSWDD